MFPTIFSFLAYFFLSALAIGQVASFTLIGYEALICYVTRRDYATPMWLRLFDVYVGQSWARNLVQWLPEKNECKCKIWPTFWKYLTVDGEWDKRTKRYIAKPTLYNLRWEANFLLVNLFYVVGIAIALVALSAAIAGVITVLSATPAAIAAFVGSITLWGAVESVIGFGFGAMVGNLLYRLRRYADALKASDDKVRQLSATIEQLQQEKADADIELATLTQEHGELKKFREDHEAEIERTRQILHLKPKAAEKTAGTPRKPATKKPGATRH